ncbi:MAG: hypothetical protein A3I44_01520 [Candidatus Sungbacteria bacterium RIFCSPLOWO2_02_FULL_51_17]|uniref:tRNA (guanine-N(1)-)-methyltransferase n=1 Tax=Candidatus Sungbacteria bacterium RIFCSPHIGHO2_02_FULL_51_29 TaxID=1802273 RepID=A0A1G2KW37_9BACT|nr:MAG: hypothetical protein A3C16_03385 [Candidatus Sungbacteria bacterium RIFCSPHIGHO2_02_FULL_51_29]OHA06384.1 MAG: hypothetical protein A3B29_04575 [Candidatus Sungbacteria bacterium RIFCSPLOWO2_01_FULL_51_34]OHA12354.1 MAG: hypothetical protein A3I44_01520 [Candidatus Sungbacteria bacterium RIFCSPLOWO2_02_FULL_51_17]
MSTLRYDILTIFPDMFGSYIGASMIKRGIAKKLISIYIHDVRDFGVGPHRKVDERPYGGGPGMVLQVGPIVKMMATLKAKPKETLVALFSAGGELFTAERARAFSKKYTRIVMIAGHYEGVDERVARILRSCGFAVAELSIGPYVLTGGELPSMVVMDAVSRHIPGFLGKQESREEERYGPGLPSYSRPEIFMYKKRVFRVPKVLLSGDHAKIDAWRAASQKPKAVS